jgi:hypothetical protein
MSQPVKLSDKLVLDARLAGDAFERSIAGQVEYWARLGRGIEMLLRGSQALALSRSGAAQSLSSCLESVDSPEGHARVASYLDSQPFPHYRAHPDRPGLLIRTDGNGRETIGRFVNREFKAEKSQSKAKGL